MPYGGNDWLALTQEPPLGAELPICDPHHHFWDFRSERIPYQCYLLHDLVADVNCGHNVRSTGFIEARSIYRPEGAVELRPVGEVEFVQGLAAASATGLYGPCRAAAAIVGHADLKLGDRVEPVLEALRAANPNRFRGIRRTVTWDPHSEVENREREGVLASSDYRAGARVLARMGLSLDTGVCFPQLPELADFARAVPDLPIILNHLGGLQRVGPYGNRDDEVLPAWRRGLAAVAEFPNVTLKFGGIGMPRLGFDWHARAKPIGSEELAASMTPMMTYCIEQFGPDRCIFESNFPVDKVSFSHHVFLNRASACPRITRARSAPSCSTTQRHGRTGSALFSCRARCGPKSLNRRIAAMVYGDGRNERGMGHASLIRTRYQGGRHGETGQRRFWHNHPEPTGRCSG